MSARHQMQGRAQALPFALIGQAIRKLSRHELEVVTERLIEYLDAIDGDCDLEDGDEDCCAARDDDTHWHYSDPLARPGDEEDAEDEYPVR